MPISTHTPLVGRDINRALSKLSKLQFLLTRPSQGATNEYGGSLIPEDISTHTPLAGRDKRKRIRTFYDNNFYSHAPRGARPLHLACNSESFPTYRGADFFIIKSSQFCRFIRYLMPLFQANLPGFLHHLFFPYHFIHAGIRNTK